MESLFVLDADGVFEQVDERLIWQLGDEPTNWLGACWPEVVPERWRETFDPVKWNGFGFRRPTWWIDAHAEGDYRGSLFAVSVGWEEFPGKTVLLVIPIGDQMMDRLYGDVFRNLKAGRHHSGEG